MIGFRINVVIHTKTEGTAPQNPRGVIGKLIAVVHGRELGAISAEDESNVRILNCGQSFDRGRRGQIKVPIPPEMKAKLVHKVGCDRRDESELSEVTIGAIGDRQAISSGSRVLKYP